MTTIDKIASGILAALAFTAAWWITANAPMWLLFIAGVVALGLAVVTGLVAIAACLHAGRIDHADEDRRRQGRGL